jgi:serine/threonine protein kinase
MFDNQSQKGVNVINFVLNKQYVSVKKIGTGGFGIIWQMYDFSLKSYVACKELLSQFFELKFVEMFYKEALIAKNIVHANIVRVEHLWKGDNGSFYILMDYVNGTDLTNLIKKCNEYQIKIPWEFSIIICMNVLRAIDYINRIATDPATNKPYGIVYRDVSPGNILISFEGNIKLSDFGIAKTADDLNTALNQSVIAGKYAYMSPEQIKGSKDIDHKSDIFSTGVVFYEMLTGKRLFSGELSEIKSCVLNQEFNKNFLDGLELPVEIGEILSKALQINKTERYERAIEMYRDLRRILKGVDEEDIISDFSSFVLKVMEKEFNDSVALSNFVKTIDSNVVNNDSSITKINASDFIAGQTDIPEQISNEDSKDMQKKSVEFKSVFFEPKGKTVFEEVDDLFRRKIGNLKRGLLKALISILILSFICLVCDIFFQITPAGEYIYNRINPSNVIITTLPQDALVSVKTKEGEVIVENENSRKPIALKKIHPGSYVVTAVKPGFVPIQRIVTIEGSSHQKQEKIELVFDRGLKVVSYPNNASVYVDGNKVGVSPCTVQLSAGEAHVLRLSLAGFSTLGSDAKEFKDGQCNIDLTKSDQEEIFSGVDRNFWDVLLQWQGNEQSFTIVGHFYKEIIFDTNPKNMILQMYGESKPRGVTPIVLRLREGDYRIEFLDPNGKYSEVIENIKVSSSTPEQQVVDMKKLITFRVKAKSSDTFLKAKLKIERKYVSFGDSVSAQLNNIIENSVNILKAHNNQEVSSDSNVFNQQVTTTSNVALNTNNTSRQENFNSVSTTSLANNISENTVTLQTNVSDNNNHLGSTNLENSSFTFLSTKNKRDREIESLENESDKNDNSNIQVININKPLSISLPIAIYKFTFFADGFEPFVKDDVDIEEINSISVELSPAKIPLKLELSYINSDGQRLPVDSAAIWVNNIMLGKSNREGKWEYKVARRRKILKGKIVAKGFMTQNFSISPSIGGNNIKKITLISKTSLPVGKEADSISSNTGLKTAKKKSTIAQKNKNLDRKTSKIETTKEGEQIVICSYCGYANVIPKGRKIRFCLNCGKPLKY